MKKQLFRIVAVILALTALVLGWAFAEGSVSSTVVMRVSHVTQSAVVDEGEDLSMEINIDGVTPASYQWYFEGNEIPGANQKVYNIISAEVSDSGLYRMDAFDENGELVMSTDIVARVIDGEVPKTGDSTMPVEYAFIAVGIAAIALFMLTKRSKKA